MGRVEVRAAAWAEVKGAAWGKVLAISLARVPEEIVYAQAVESGYPIRLVSGAWISPAQNAAPEWLGNETIMKTLITVTAPDIHASLDPRFGRAAYFLLVDTETLSWEAKPNPAIHASGGAGIKAAQFAADSGCEAVVSGDCGPNAYEVLEAAGISMYLFGASQTIQQVVEGLKSGELEKLGSPSSPGHHGR